MYKKDGRWSYMEFALEKELMMIGRLLIAPAETGGCPDPYGSRCGVGIDDADLQVWLQ